MKITVTDMTQYGGDQPVRRDVALGFGYTLRQSRDRHADIGGERLRPRPQTASGPIGVVSRLPQARSVLGLHRPFERRGAEIARDFAEAFGLLGNTGRRTV